MKLCFRPSGSSRRIASGNRPVSAQATVMTTDLSSLRDMAGVAAYPHNIISLAAEDKTMAATISRLGNVKIEPFKESRFVRPESVYYQLDGETRRWDVVDAHDSIAVVLYHRTMKAMLLVRQFRPALYAGFVRAAAAAGEDTNIPLVKGFTCELCAGIVDKELSLEDIAREEIEEECGYQVPVGNIKKITSFAASVGIQGSTQTLFYAEVDDSMKVENNGGVVADGERIELLALPIADLNAFVLDASIPKTSGAMFGLIWGQQLVHEQVSVA